jgi:hypothetical protein
VASQHATRRQQQPWDGGLQLPLAVAVNACMSKHSGSHNYALRGAYAVVCITAAAAVQLHLEYSSKLGMSTWRMEY